MPARVSDKWILDLEARPTDVTKVTSEEVGEALYALQIRHTEGASLDAVLQALVVALVKHMKVGGHYRAVLLDEDTALSDFHELPKA